MSEQKTKPRIKAVVKATCTGCVAQHGTTCSHMPSCTAKRNSHIPGRSIIFKEIGRDPVKTKEK